MSINTTRFHHSVEKTSSTNYKEIPVLDDWAIERRWNEANQLVFSSPLTLTAGDHIRVISDHMPNFGGQITYTDYEKNDYNEYECLDYKRYLLTELTYKATNQTASQILDALKGNISVLNFQIQPTKNVYPELEWEGTLGLEIIGNLLNLEYKAGTLIYFNVDMDANLRFEPYPTRMTGYSLSSAYNYSSTADWSEIVTTGRMYRDGAHQPSDSIQNPELMKIWGDIAIERHYTDSTVEEDEMDMAELRLMNLTHIQRPLNDPEEIDNIVEHINNTYSDIPSKITDPVDGVSNWEMSEIIYDLLKSEGVSTRIIRYYSATDPDNTRYTTQVKYPIRGWEDYNYTNHDTFHKPLPVRQCSKPVDNYVHEVIS